MTAVGLPAPDADAGCHLGQPDCPYASRRPGLTTSIGGETRPFALGRVSGLSWLLLLLGQLLEQRAVCLGVVFTQDL